MGGTGIVRDDIFMEHDPGKWHPENPVRLRSIYRHLDSRDWPGLVVLDPRRAEEEEICLVHTPDHYARIASLDGQQASLDADTWVSPRSCEAAHLAAGGLISLTQKVMDRELDNGFALVRPPGHHAEAYRAMGFCLFNNIAVAAAWALKAYDLARVLIVDWDLHHGNGTQHSFYKDPRVMYFSTHQYPFYPGTGAVGECGLEAGRGFTVNAPLSWGHGDQEYVAIFQRILAPIARMYQPQLILVSAGFDIHHGDPLGDMKVTREGFAAMTRVLMDLADELCGGRLVLTLEGGYNVEGQTRGVASVLDALTNQSDLGMDLAGSCMAEPEIAAVVRRTHSAFWTF
jgi:acetoin utilization deacetylase AcuC-like enzyme